MTAAGARTGFGGTSTAGGWLVGAIAIACLTEAVASTILAIGRTDIIGDVAATPDEFAWLDISYVAAKLIGFALAPWWLGRAPPLRVLIAATVTMGVACALAALVLRLEILILLRAVQGLAGGVLLVSGQAILFWSYPASRQPLLQALFAIGSVVAPATLAPAFDGWLVDAHAWTSVFLAALPLSIAAVALMLVDDRAMPPVGQRRPFDGAGLALLGAGLLAATYVIGQGSRWDWFEEGRIVSLALVSIGALGLFVFRPAWLGRGLLDAAPFATDDFRFAFVVSFVAGAALFGSAFLIPAFALSVLGFTPTAAGALLLPSGALFLFGLLASAYLFQAKGLAPIATVPLGILLIMAAMWRLAGSSGESGAADMMPAVLLRGLGLGFLFLSITLIAFTRLAPPVLAYGIGLFNIGRQLGGLIGVAALQTVIDHESVANRSILAAALNTGSPMVADRLAATTSHLVASGLDAAAAAKVSAAMLGRAVAQQSAVIAFDTAFTLITLLFVVAGPILVAFKLVLAGRARRDGGG